VKRIAYFTRLPPRNESMHTRVRLTTIASTKALAGADLRFVQDWLGHAKIQNGIIYTFLTARTREQSARRLRSY
jgi:site-specific recombinase XerD